MAESSRSDPNRSSTRDDEHNRVRRKSSGKSTTEKQEKTDQSDKTWNPLRTLKNFFLGSWRRESQLDEGNHKEPHSPLKAKSSDNIFHGSRRDERKPGIMATTATVSANPSPKQSRNSSAIGKQLSVSVDNLVSSNRLTAPPRSAHSSTLAAVGGPSAKAAAISDRNGSEASTLDAVSSDEMDDRSVSDRADDFFVDRWLQPGQTGNRPRAFSSGDAEEVDQNPNFDLDAIHRTKALDVSVFKDRIAIKPKGKKLASAMQEKVNKAEVNARPPNRVQLQSLVEVDEEEFPNDNARTKELRNSTRSSGPQSPVLETTGPPPEAPPRRKRSQGMDVAEKSSYRNTIGIAITPAMLTGALKKPAGRDGAIPATKSNNSEVFIPPLDGVRKRKPEPLPGGSENKQTNDVSASKDPATGDTAGGVTGGSSLKRPVVRNCSEEEKDYKGARPKEPPKTRPKTMLHTASTSPRSTEPTTEPDWMTRAKQKSAILE